MKTLRVRYWLPRALIVGFALSLLLPMPKFLSTLDAGGLTLWMARLIWVISIPAVFCFLLMFIAVLKKKDFQQRRH